MQAAEYGAPLFAGEHLALRLAATLIVFIVVILLCVRVIVVAIVVVNLVVILVVVILFIVHSPKCVVRAVCRGTPSVQSS